MEVGPCPDASPGLGRMLWDGPCTEAWEELGWKPSGLDEYGDSPTTRCVYSIEAVIDTGLPSSEWAYETVAICDGDGDGQQAMYRAERLGTPAPETADDVY